MFNIDKNVPVDHSRGAPTKYPFDEMEIGDSFFVPANDRDTSKLRVSVQNSGTAKYGSGSMSTTIREEDGVLGVRIWRVA